MTIMFHTIYCTTKVTPALDAHPVPVRFNQVKISVPDAGGGKITPPKSAAYMITKRISSYERTSNKSPGRTGE
jgi:hypothetical protein